MGLKLHHLDTRGATGDLDGVPFHLTTEGKQFHGQIGDSQQAFKAVGSLDLGLTESAIRNAVYWVIAQYRIAQRQLQHG